MTEAEFLQQFVTEARLQRFREVLSQRTRHLTIVLEDVFHEHNASACLRTCDCFGLQEVHVVESINEFQPNQDIALGSNQWLDIFRYSNSASSCTPSLDQCYEQLRRRHFQILATSPRQDSVPLAEIDCRKPTAIVFGAEQVGVSQQAIDQADGLVHIPMFGFTESFNVSVSVALVLQQLSSQIRASDSKWQLTAADSEAVLATWVRHSLKDKLPPLLRRFRNDFPKEFSEHEE